jgi:hypothetical protein
VIYSHPDSKNIAIKYLINILISINTNMLYKSKSCLAFNKICLKIAPSYTVGISNWEIVEAYSIPLTHIHTTDYSPVGVAINHGGFKHI